MSLAQAVSGLTGPFLVGTALSTFLCGVTLAQSYTYFTTFPNDRAPYRLSVSLLVLLDIGHTVLSQITLWIWFVQYYGDPSKVAWAPWSFAVSPVLCGVATFVVQMFYAYRLYILGNGSPFIPSLILFGSLWQFAWSIGATVEIFVTRYFSEFHVWTYGVAAWLGGAAATDCLVTSSLVWSLMHAKGSFRRTNTILDRLISLTIETNGLTFTIATIDLIMFAEANLSSNSWHIVPNLCLIKLYTNSFLVSLNSREKLAENLGFSRRTRESSPEPMRSQTAPVFADETGRATYTHSRNGYEPDADNVDTTGLSSLVQVDVERTVTSEKHEIVSTPADTGKTCAMNNLDGIRLHEKAGISPINTHCAETCEKGFESPTLTA